jgi:hypothetical protein
MKVTKHIHSYACVLSMHDVDHVRMYVCVCVGIYMYVYAYADVLPLLLRAVSVIAD